MKQPVLCIQPSALQRPVLVAAVGLGVLLASACSDRAAEDKAKAKAAAAPVPVAQTVEQLEAAVPDSPLKEAYFGETHVHTSYSLDGYILSLIHI